MLKSSLIGTPSATHLVRSMSKYNQGVLARELLKSPCKPGVLLPRSTIRSLIRWRSANPRLPRSSMMSLKPPVVPKPSIGGAPNAVTIAPRISR